VASASPSADVGEPELPALGPADDLPSGQHPAEPSTPEPDVDPIAAAPHAKWFVRPPSGGQFGPASGPVLKNWLAEGRVTPDSHVWREGWAEWQPAQSVFGSLVGSSDSGPASPSVPEIKPQAGPATVSDLYRRRKSSNMTAAVVGLLGLACAVLFAALVYVVRFMK